MVSALWCLRRRGRTQAHQETHGDGQPLWVNDTGVRDITEMKNNDEIIVIVVSYCHMLVGYTFGQPNPVRVSWEKTLSESMSGQLAYTDIKLVGYYDTPHGRPPPSRYERDLRAVKYRRGE